MVRSRHKGGMGPPTLLRHSPGGSPTFPLRLGNPCACFRAQRTLLWFRRGSLLRTPLVPDAVAITSVGQQGPHLMQPCNFRINCGEYGLMIHSVISPVAYSTWSLLGICNRTGRENPGWKIDAHLPYNEPLSSYAATLSGSCTRSQ